MHNTVICPGSFDPVTLGHIDIITRASKMFDNVIVGVFVNGEKHPAFTIEERISFLERTVGDIPNVRVIGCDGLLAQCAKDLGATAVVRGLRAVSDFEYEFQMALTNRKLNPIFSLWQSKCKKNAMLKTSKSKKNKMISKKQSF